jgi:hypothetical protein
MALITLPTWFKPSTCAFVQSVNQRVVASPFGGSEQAIDMLNDRWICTVELPGRMTRDGAALEAFIGSMRGQVNTTLLHHFARPIPRGTVRGTLTLNAAAAQGASSIEIAGCDPAGGTLLAGDMLGAGGLLLMVESDSTAVAGVITVPITNRLRTALLIGEAVTWYRPTAAFRLISPAPVNYSPGIAGPVSLDFREAI